MLTLLKSWPNVQYVSRVNPISVRWATKPRWVPIAKTKKFFVPPRFPESPEKVAEVKRLFDNYRTLLRASLNKIRQLHQENETATEVIEKLEAEKEDAWQQALKLNDEWNRQVAIEREQRTKEQYEQDVEEAVKRMQIEDEKHRKWQEEADALIREQKMLSKTFITSENIDAHIDRILNSPPHSFNYAIDSHGNVYDDLSKTPTRSVDELHPSSEVELPLEEKVETTG